MNTRDELIQYLLTIDGDQMWAEDLVDAYATETVKAVADDFERILNTDGSFLHEMWGSHDVLTYLRQLFVAYGTIESTVDRDIQASGT